MEVVYKLDCVKQLQYMVLIRDISAASFMLRNCHKLQFNTKYRIQNSFNPALVWWGITNPSHIFCYAIMVFGNTIFFPPVYLHLI